MRKTEAVLIIPEARALRHFSSALSLRGGDGKFKADSEVKTEIPQEAPLSRNGSTLSADETPRAAQNIRKERNASLPRVAFELPPPEQRMSYAHQKNRLGGRKHGMKPRQTFGNPPERESASAPSRTSIERVNSRSPVKPPVEARITDSSYPTGLPWRPMPIREVYTKQPPISPKNPLTEREALRHSLCQILGTTLSSEEGWQAYSTLLMHPPEDPAMLAVPFPLMHRVCRLLARHRPKTRTEFMRLHSVLAAIREAGGTIHRHEWNALIDSAGKGMRKTTTVDYESALSFFRDMTLGRAPGTTLSHGEEEHGAHITQPVEPDIYTYTALINIAARTHDSRCFQHASSLLQESGLPPNRITHLALVKYFTATKQLSGVRTTLLKMQQQNLEVGLDGINALLNSYSYNDRLDVVMMIYRLLRHNAFPETHVGDDDVESVADQLQREEFIVVAPDMKPNEVTYVNMIQTMAYHGNFVAALTVFVDMMLASNLERGAPLVDKDGILIPTTYQPTIAVYRAIFLGFTRHGTHLLADGDVSSHHRTADAPGQPSWTLSNLEKIYNAFLELPKTTQPGQSIIYWIIVAFKKTSGNDVVLLRRVWKQMESKFDGPWGGPDNRLQKMKATLFPGDEGDLPPDSE